MSADGPLHHKFDVNRTDGRSAVGEKHHGCDYFVLDLTHDPYAAAAVAAYAVGCASTHPTLAADLNARLAASASDAPFCCHLDNDVGCEAPPRWDVWVPAHDYYCTYQSCDEHLPEMIDFSPELMAGLQIAPIGGEFAGSNAPTRTIRTVDIVFDGPPGHESGRFVEVENPDGTATPSIGTWLERGDYWVLRTTVVAPTGDRT